MESNYSIATLADGLKNRAPVFPPVRSKAIRSLYGDFSSALNKFKGNCKSSDWFIALFVPIVIGRKNYLLLVYKQKITDLIFFIYYYRLLVLPSVGFFFHPFTLLFRYRNTSQVLTSLSAPGVYDKRIRPYYEGEKLSTPMPN